MPATHTARQALAARLAAAEARPTQTTQYVKRLARQLAAMDAELGTTRGPREIDMELADLHIALHKATEGLASARREIISASGARYYYRGRRRVTDRTFEEAAEIVTNWLANDRFKLISHGADRTEMVLNERIPALVAEVAELTAAIDKANAEYTGWSRFFLVTSSPGHIHSSMSCHTCRPTTTYGWLPELSGKTEAEAVEAHGPALCSACFPSAPTEWVGGKISKAKAEKAAHR